MSGARWQRTLWIMFAAQLISAVGFAVIFPFLPLYVAELGTNTGLGIEFWVGMVFSSQAITMAIASPLWGSLSDRLGHKLMVQRAMFGGAVVLLLMGFARSAEELALLRAVQGALTGTISAANALLAAEAPKERLGYAMGILQMGLWGGLSAGPMLGGVLADAYGYRMPFFLTAALLALAGLLVAFGVRGGGRPAPGARPKGQGLVAGWRAILTARGMLPTYGLRFLSSLAHTMLLPFTPLFIQTLMLGEAALGTFTGLVVGLASAAGTATAIYFGRLGDRVGHKQVLIACAAAAALLYLPQALVVAPWQLLALQVLSGAAWGGVTPALGALLARYGGGGREGAIYGLDNSLVAGARALAPVVGALVVTAFGLRGLFVATAVIYAVVAAGAAARLPGSGHAPAAAPRRT
ncbi:MAG TPA: MFS transporter [Chloroflexaceae bacterium]|nr:MFS transporter [Chloroflexaceae bacterium]